MVVRPRPNPPIESKEGMERIIEVLYEMRGRISLAAKKLGVSTRAMYQMVERNPEVQDIIDHARKLGKEDGIDEREVYIETFTERYEDDATNGLKAAMYFLNTHGGARGWGKDTPELTEEMAKIRAIMENKVGDPPKPAIE